MTSTGTISAIKRTSLHEELSQSLERLIVDGVLAPGTKVPEKELCEKFNVSRTPLREALKVLAQRGLVLLEPNRGAWVSRTTVAELEELFPVMSALEALSGELACRNITGKAFARIERLHGEMLRRYEARDRAGYFALNEKIHEAILEAADNLTLTAHYRSLALRVRRVRYLANMSEARWRRAIDEHEAILAQLRARDAAALSATLKAHLENKLETVRAWIEADDATREGEDAGGARLPVESL